MDNSVLRDDMVDGLEHSLELLPEAVSIAMRSVPRHEFVTDSPYQNRPTEHRDTNTTILAQLADGGRLVMPKGVGEQTLVAVEDGEVAESFGPLSFKPLLVDGEQTGSIVRNRTRREDPEYEGRGWHAGHGWEQDWIDWGGSG